MMPALFSAAFNDFSKLILSGPWARRALFCAGLVLIASGCFHLVVFLGERGSWEGPVSWRKPILFGFSGGVTVLSVGWVVSLVSEGKLHADWIKRIEPWFCLSFALAMVAEVALITLQTWRGEASHFNESTPLNTTIFYLIGFLTIYGALAILALTVVSFAPLPGPPDQALAARLGLMLLVLACGLG
jgi:hypothetical protein